jgi:hypothetical protein
LTVDIEQIKKIVGVLSAKLEADFFLFNAEISNQTADSLIEEARKIPEKQENAALILTTPGGNADAAFRIMRFLQRKYEKVILYVFGFCKSAGTLMALGADEIVMSDFGEFGPLDVQIYKSDEFARSSGLDIHQSLHVIGIQAYIVYEYCFAKILEGSDGIITIKTAADIASSMAVGLLAPITAQIDPLRLGETHRDLQVARDYGQRLSIRNSNPQTHKTIATLTSGYHSHSFVIDYEEAKDLFTEVRELTETEQSLEKLLLPLTRWPLPADRIVEWIDPTFNNSEGGENEKNSSDDTNSHNGGNSESDREDTPGTISANYGDNEEN